MLTLESVARAAKSAGIEAPSHYLEVTGSTNTELLALAEQGAPAWTVLAAGHQVEGRGRLDRTWESKPGASLLVSVLLRPDLPPTDSSLVTLAAGACMAMSCSVACGVDVRCKWPNDLLVADRKLGGVLTEAKVERGRLAHVVVGVGMNLEQRAEDFPPELRGSATSVANEGGRPDGPALLFEFLLRLTRFGDPSRPGFRETVLDMYRRVCQTIGRTVRATTATGRHVEGRATGVGDWGQLVVETDRGPEEVTFGEITHLR
ncbi:MAG: biotin--[acetyl-CoA-carboxylase] ligase [Actinobacteria bacterium]|nr:MAG: biotin--[acetyl-CoA-carboxylase] ligase [Actinomycetota bacterium]